MSKISGIDLGDPNKPFQVFGTQLGGRDAAITVQRPSANIHRDKLTALAREISGRMKEIRATIERLEVMKEMMLADDDTDSIILDKAFVQEYDENVKKLRNTFEEVLKATQQ